MSITKVRANMQSTAARIRKQIGVNKSEIDQLNELASIARRSWVNASSAGDKYMIIYAEEKALKFEQHVKIMGFDCRWSGDWPTISKDGHTYLSSSYRIGLNHVYHNRRND